MINFIIALALFVPCLAQADVYLTNTGASAPNSITLTPLGGGTLQIRTAANGSQTSTTTTGNHPLNIDAGLGGALNLNTVGSGPVNSNNFLSGNITSSGTLNFTDPSGKLLSKFTQGYYPGNSYTQLATPGTTGTAENLDFYAQGASGDPNFGYLSISTTTVYAQTPEFVVYGTTSAAPPGNSTRIVAVSPDFTAIWDFGAFGNPGNTGELIIGDDLNGTAPFSIANGAPTGSLGIDVNGALQVSVSSVNAQGLNINGSSNLQGQVQIGTSPRPLYVCTGGASDSLVSWGGTNAALCPGGTWVIK